MSTIEIQPNRSFLTQEFDNISDPLGLKNLNKLDINNLMIIVSRYHHDLVPLICEQPPNSNSTSSLEDRFFYSGIVLDTIRKTAKQHS